MLKGGTCHTGLQREGGRANKPALFSLKWLWLVICVHTRNQSHGNSMSPEPSSRLHGIQCESDLYKACNSHCTCGRKQVPLTLDRNTGMCVKGVMQWLKIVISGKHGKQTKGSESADILHSLATVQWAPGQKRGGQSTDAEAGWKEAVGVKALLSWRQMGRP